MTFVKPNKTKKQNQTDKVMTLESVALKIISYFKPTGTILEPARGTGSFHKYLKGDWCEIDEGRDFFTYHNKVDWIITNPPYSIYDNFLLHSFDIADNIVFLVPLAKAFKSQKIENAISKYGGLKEIVMMGGGGNVGFNFGFPVGCLYYKRNYKGDCKITKMLNKEIKKI
jgi:hypothetical protein